MTICLIVSGLGSCVEAPTRQGPDTVQILEAAVQHARGVIPEGRIQLDSTHRPEPPFQSAEADVLDAAADRVNAGVGPGQSALECDSLPRRCRGKAGFRGIVEVGILHEPGTAEAVVRIHMYLAMATPSSMEYRGDTLYMRKVQSGWTIRRVERFAES